MPYPFSRGFNANTQGLRFYIYSDDLLRERGSRLFRAGIDPAKELECIGGVWRLGKVIARDPHPDEQLARSVAILRRACHVTVDAVILEGS